MADRQLFEITEIYICRFEQRLEEALLEVSDEIKARQQALEDAEERCRRDPEIARIFYYRVREDGKFRSIYLHLNLEAMKQRRAIPGAIPLLPIQLHRAREMLRRQEHSLWMRFARVVNEYQKPLQERLRLLQGLKPPSDTEMGD